MKDHPFIGQSPRPGNTVIHGGSDGAETRPQHPLLVFTIVLLLLATAAAMLTSTPATDYGDPQDGRPHLPATG